MSETGAENIYEAPESGVGLEPKDCPQCGLAMEHGRLATARALRWVDDDENPFRRFLFGGEKVTAKSSLWG